MPPLRFWPSRWPCLLRCPAQPASPIFTYHSSFWLNLHHFLYVLGRVEAKMPDIIRRAVAGAPDEEAQGLGRATDDERHIWREVVAAYATAPSRRDPVFDRGLIAAGQALARACDAASLEASGVAPDLVELLERAAPIYRRVWWHAHERANEARWADIAPLMQAHGPRVLAFITRIYQEAWPVDGYPLQFAAWVNWAGACLTGDRHLVVASMDGGPRGLSHSMIFYTAGEAMRAVTPEHATYADQNGIWRGRMGAYKPLLDEAWRPHLQGAGTLDDAIRAIVVRLP